jgi:acetylornithine deacetylase/succinyl-diaminopimelate desuccinylase-like protein
VARGGADNKGQHLANVLGALDAFGAGRSRWRVRIILDGEEESNSPSLNAIALAHRDRFDADVLIGSDGPKQRNAPTLVMGVRGLIAIDIVADNGEEYAVHSGNYGNIVPNPVLPVAALIKDLDARLRDWAEEHDSFRKEALETFDRWAEPANWQPFLLPGVNVNHIQTDGTSATLTRTVIPRSAHARLDVRITPDVPPEAVDSLFEAALAEQKQRYPGVRFSVKRAVTPSSATSAARPEFEWLLGLLAKQGGGSPPVAIPLLGGTLPVWVFTETLGLPAFWLPAANSDNNQHDLNEHFIVRHFFSQVALYDAIVSSLPGE